MLTHQSILSQLENFLYCQFSEQNSVNGQSIYRIIHSNYLEQGDESSIQTIVIALNIEPVNTEETETKIQTVHSLIQSLNPNDLFSDPDDSEGIELFYITNHLTGFYHWRTRCHDTFIIQETDSTFYITIIQSGQY